MTAALILLAAIAGVGLILYLTHRPDADSGHTGDNADSAPAGDAAAADEGCCGMHITCERDSLLAAVSPNIEYYDDEELDRFAGRGAEDYADADIEEFRDVLLTMHPDDIAGWARSLQLRGITMPLPVREELIMIVAEERAARAAKETATIHPERN